jgi:hypothetical protein
MLGVETSYLDTEKLCLCLFFTYAKLRHILLSAETIVICKSDVIKHILLAPLLKGRLRNGCLHCQILISVTSPMKAVKGQALADLIAESININVVALSMHVGHVFQRIGLR